MKLKDRVIDNYQKYLRIGSILKRTDYLIYRKNCLASEILKPKITVIIVNWYSTDHIVHLLDSMISKAEHAEDLSFLICDNTNGQDASLQRLSAPNLKIITIDSSPYRGSMAASLAMMKGFSEVKTEYGLIVHPDCIVLADHWDTLLKRAIKKHGAVAIGAPYPPWALGKYHDYPGPHFHFFCTEAMRKVGFDLRNWPDDFLHAILFLVGRHIVRLGRFATRDRLRKSTKLRNLVERLESKLGVVSTDTGWRHAKKTVETGMKIILFGVADARDFDSYPDNKRRIFIKLAKEFEFYMWNDLPMVVHLYSTNSPGHSLKRQEIRKKEWLEMLHSLREVL